MRKSYLPQGLLVPVSYTHLDVYKRQRVVTYSVENDADYRGSEIQIGTDGSSFILYHGGKEYPVRTNLVAMYNISNLLAAIAAMAESGIPLEEILPYVNSLTQVDGRMERIDEGQLFNVIVDFAHTPDGLEKVFEYAKSITEEGHAIISVFGLSLIHI